MMPLRIRRKGRATEKSEIPTALQRCGKTFQYNAANRIALARQVANTSDRAIVCDERAAVQSAVASHPAFHGPDELPRTRKIAPRTDLAGYERIGQQSFRILRQNAGKTAGFVKFSGIGPKFLAVQRRTF
jgi:hypothetical protein